MLQRAASNAYSWWWASHIRTNQSKWLCNSLQEMEERIEAMLKLVEEDADSFAKKAEMYYKRRPELINFVQEFYKSYRGLAERYDHISGELQKANNIIATIFPDKHFGMDDEDEISSQASVPKAAFFDSSNFFNESPTTISGTIDYKKVDPEPTNDNQETEGPISQTLMDDVKEIEKLQKEILILQTEKEFIKVSYESVLTKYWDIEKKIADMQEKIYGLQDKSSTAMAIEDDEARALMAVTALKSCEEVLIKLQEQQNGTVEEAKIESQRTESLKDKLKALKGDDFQQPKGEETSQEDAQKSPAQENVEVVYSLNREEMKMKSIYQKVRKSFKSSSETKVMDFADKIDDLVSKVVALETDVSSQTTQMYRLRMENDELHKQLQNLEDENRIMTENSKGLSEKIRQAEEELQRIKNLDMSIHNARNILQSHFHEACHSFKELSDKLKSPEKQEDIVAADLHWSHDVDQNGETSQECQNEEIWKYPMDVSSDKSSILVVGSENPKNFSVQDHIVDSEKPITPEYDANTHNIRSPRNIERSTTRRSEESITNAETKQNYLTQDEQLCINSNHQEKEVDKDGGSFPNWNGIFMTDLEEKQKILLAEYTSILRSYKEIKRKLLEAEKKRQDYILDTMGQIRDLKNSIVMKDEEIRSLRQKLNLLESSWHQNGDVNSPKPQPSMTNTLLREGKQKISYSRSFNFLLGKLNIARFENGRDVSSIPCSAAAGELDELFTGSPFADLKAHKVDEQYAASAIEEKFRGEIDELLEENLGFWLRFGSSFQHIQDYETNIKDIQTNITGLKDKMRQEGSIARSAKADATTFYRQLMDLQTDLSVWIEQNALLKEELHIKFSSLCNMKEEIVRVCNEGGISEGDQLTTYQGSRFLGEIADMQQENNKVAEELQAGLAYVKNLQAVVEKMLAELNENFDISGTERSNCNHLKSSSKIRVPLRNYLFGAKPKKQSTFFCMNPAMQKQFSDLTAARVI